MVYREFFPRGLTALDEINEDDAGQRPSASHVTARDEVKRLIDALKLPIDERGKRRAAARAEWAAAAGKPLDTHGLFAPSELAFRSPARRIAAHCAGRARGHL